MGLSNAKGINMRRESVRIIMVKYYMVNLREFCGLLIPPQAIQQQKVVIMEEAGYHL